MDNDKPLSNTVIVRGHIFSEPIVIKGTQLIEIYDDKGELCGFLKFIDDAMFMVASKADPDWEQSKALAGLHRRP